MFDSVTNVGVRPTFGPDSFAIESHLLNFHEIELTLQRLGRNLRRWALPIYSLKAGSGLDRAFFNAVPPVLPFIKVQPADTTVTVGATAKFRVKAGGTKPLKYQWKKNGKDIRDATSGTYETPPTTLQDDGAVFAVLISDRAGSVISNNATLTVQ